MYCACHVVSLSSVHPRSHYCMTPWIDRCGGQKPLQAERASEAFLDECRCTMCCSCHTSCGLSPIQPLYPLTFQLPRQTHTVHASLSRRYQKTAGSDPQPVGSLEVSNLCQRQTLVSPGCDDVSVAIRSTRRRSEAASCREAIESRR